MRYRIFPQLSYAIQNDVKIDVKIDEKSKHMRFRINRIKLPSLLNTNLHSASVLLIY